MNHFALYESFGSVDDDMLERSETGAGKPRAFKWPRWAAAAACLCLLAAALLAVPSLLRAPGPSGTDPGPAGEPDRTWTLAYNNASALLPDTAPKAGFFLFSEALTAEELAALLPDAPEGWMQAEGAAVYYGGEELAQIALTFQSAAWHGSTGLSLYPAGKELDSDTLIEPDAARTTAVNGVEVTAYQYADESAGILMLWARFERDGVRYALSSSPAMADAERAKSDLADIVACCTGAAAPDLSRFAPREAHIFVDETLSLADALKSEPFGAYLLPAAPAGYAAESVRRHQDDDSNFLSATWTKGYDTISWRVSAYGGEAARRVTAVEAVENYDLSLYPIPRADSVPEELRQIVDHPIFRIEELTMEAVSRRAYFVSEAGDSTGARMSFGVLYGDIVVEVTAKGVTPAWLYEQLRDLSG